MDYLPFDHLVFDNIEDFYIFVDNPDREYVDEKTLKCLETILLANLSLDKEVI